MRRERALEARTGHLRWPHDGPLRIRTDGKRKPAEARTGHLRWPHDGPLRIRTDPFPPPAGGGKASTENANPQRPAPATSGGRTMGPSGFEPETDGL